MICGGIGAIRTSDPSVPKTHLSFEIKQSFFKLSKFKNFAAFFVFFYHQQRPSVKFPIA
jgi:hypothetical protein